MTISESTIRIVDGIAHCPMTNSDKYFVIDAENLSLLLAHNDRWALNEDGYPYCRSKLIRIKTRKTVSVSHAVFGKWKDHIDRNPLNNLESNLRDSTIQQNNFNNSIRQDNTSGYKGVSWNKKSKVWSAYIRINKQLKHLGSFSTKELAAKEYNAAAILCHKEFAVLNAV